MAYRNKKRVIRWISIVLIVFLFMNINTLPGLAFELYEEYQDQAKWTELLSAGDDILKNTFNEVTGSESAGANVLKDKEKLDLKAKKHNAITANKEYKTDRFIIKYKDESDIKAAIDSLGEKVKDTKINDKAAKITVVTTNDLMAADDLLTGLEQKGKQGAIEYIQPDFEMMVAAVDPLLDEQWGHYQLYTPPAGEAQDQHVPGKENTSKVGPEPSEPYRMDANVLEAWETTMGEGTLVALLDTGIDLTHEDLTNSIWSNTTDTINGQDDDSNGHIDDVQGWDFFNKDNTVNDSQWKYDQWHGTHIAGIIAAQADNGKGIAGVAPEAKILPLKVFQGGTAYTSDIIEAIQYAEAMGAKVVNASWGSLYENPALHEAISNSEMLFVCAAGNRLYNLDEYPVYPAAYTNEMDNVIAVASLDMDGRLSRFSSYGPETVDIAAPGEGIMSAWLNNGYNVTSGTSMAAGYVSGAAALLLGKNSQMTAAEIKERLIMSGDQVTGLLDKVVGGKKLNCGYAVSSAAAPNVVVIDVPDGSMPEMTPDGIPEEEYELSNAENYIDIKADMPTARHGLGVATVHDKIYAIGGQTTTSSGYSNKVEEYDPATNTWVTKANMPRTKSYFGIAVVDNKIYTIGGFNGSYLNHVDVYDPATNTWSTKAGMPVSMRAFTATAYEDKIYVIGGYTGSYRNTVYEYNTTTNTWTQKTNMLSSRAEHAAFYHDGKIYVSGGRNTQLVVSTEMYDLSSDTVSGLPWLVYGQNVGVAKTNERIITIGGSLSSGSDYSSIIMSKSLNQPHSSFFSSASMMFARGALGTALVNGKVYIIGGRNNSGIFSLVEEMDLGWVDKNDLPQPTRDFQSISLNGKLYMLGGLIDNNGELQKTKSVYEYNPLTAEWLPKADMPIYARDYALTSAYGKIYFIGGLTNTDPQGNTWNSFSNKVYEYDPGQDTWTEKASISNGRTYFSAVFWNGKIYIAGGWNLSGEYKTVEVYDPLTDIWQTKADLPDASHLNYMTVLGNQIYMISGSTACIYTYDAVLDLWQSRYEWCNWNNFTNIVINLYDTVYKFQLSDSTIPSIYQYHYQANDITFYNSFNFFGQLYRGTVLDNKIYLFTGDNDYADRLVEYTPPVTPWVAKSSPGQANAYGGAGVIDNNIYSVGGRADNQPLDRLEMYDSSNGIWQDKASINYRRHSLGVSVVNNKLYAIGGENNSSKALNHVEEYDPVTDTWTTKASIPSATAGMATASANGKIYIFGGYNSSGSALSSVREYNPLTNTWATKASMPTVRYACSAATIDGKIYVVGGYNSSNQAVNTVQMYDPVSNTWTTKAVMPTKRAYAGVAARDSLYVVGGTDGISEMGTVHEYSPVLDKWFSWPGPNISRYALDVAVLNEGLYAINGTDNLYCYSMTEFAPLGSQYAEYLHMGKEEVNLSGNYSRTYMDMEIPAPGFNINVSRTYNSKDDRTTGNLISRGWTFGFQGKLDSSGNDTIVRLPDGSGQTFRQNIDGSYTAKDSRSILVKQGDGSHILTTKDKYTYGFNSNGYLIWMKDRNGNAVNITVNASGQVTSIIDQAGRSFTITYSSGQVYRITGPVGQIITYYYDISGRLNRVTDPVGNNTYYSYDSQGYLINVKDHNSNVMETIEYSLPVGEQLYKVKKITNTMGNVENYEYINSEGKVTVTDINNRVSHTWYDKSLYPIRIQDAEGKQTRISYNLESGLNKYGEQRMVVDRNGNTTYYDRDNKGNITRIINPDNSTKEYAYDEKDNLISAKEEDGKYTFYVYDDDKIYLVKKAQPLNGTDIYSLAATQDDFAITSYNYYTAAEAQSLFGRSIAGLLKSETDPLGNVTTNTYDNRGNIASVKDPLDRVTTYQYNTIGWLKQKTTPGNFTTKYYYDKNGRLLKQVQHGGETERFLYDYRGNVTKRALPKQYTPASDTTTFTTENIVNSVDAYSPDHGYRYTYNTKGQLISEKDPLNNITGYAYDLYGNKTQETKPNGAIYLYDYDVMNRLVETSFKEDSTASVVVLEEHSYAILSDGKTTKGKKQYFSDSEYAETISTYDYANRLVRQDNPDSTYTTVSYNLNGTVESKTDARGNTTYYAYDGLNRLTATWSPLEEVSGTVKYAYSGKEYNKAGWVSKEIVSKLAVDLDVVPEASATSWTAYVYYSDGKTQQKTDSLGGRTEYEYDNDGNLSMEEQYTSIAEKNTIEYTFNHLPKLTQKRTYIEKKDIYGQPETDELMALTSNYTYDPNGNTLTFTDANNITTTNTYDQMNRLLNTSQPGLNEQGSPVTISSSNIYDWAGNILTQTNENGWITNYTYDKRGFLSKVTDAKNGVTSYAYDLAGRKIAEVLPNHYLAGTVLSEMNRTELEYDEMSRILRKISIYIKPGTGTFAEVTAEAYQYDANGNMILKQDALGYNEGYGTEYIYDLANRLISVLDPVNKNRGLSFSIKYEYDGLGRIVKETAANGVETDYIYDDRANLLSKSVDGTLVQTNTYDLVGNRLTATDGNGHTTITTYNTLNLAKKMTLPGDDTIEAYSVSYKYSLAALLAQQKDSLDKEILSTYDNQGRQLSQIERRINLTESITTLTRYDKRGNIRFQIDGKGNITESVYDQLDRRTSIIARGTNIQNPAIQSTTYTYDANGNQLSETDLWGNTYTYMYDPLNRSLEKKDPYNKRIEKLIYNDNNLQIASIDALENTTEFFYDKNNRLVVTEDPVSNITSQTYDNVGNIDSKTDGNGNTTFFTYDALKRLVAVENALGEITSHIYDAVGNMITQTDGSGNITTFEYNARSLVVRKVDSGGITEENGILIYAPAKTEAYTYHADGQMSEKVDRNGVLSQYAFDIHGRLTLETVDNDAVSYTYDNNGNQLTMTDATGTTTRAYDPLNRVLSKTVPVLGTSNFAYDITAGLPAGHVGSSTTDPKGNTVTKILDKAGRLYQVKDGTTVTATYTYYDNGSLQKLQYPGSSEEYTYYPNNLLHTLVNKSGGTIHEAYNYSYDEAGNQISKLDEKGTTSYIYDQLNRLLTVTEPDGKVTSYTFDDSGNRENETVTVAGTSVSATIYTYNEQNRLLQTEKTLSDGTVETVTYTYDNNGNMLSQLQSLIKDDDSSTENLGLSQLGFDSLTEDTIYEYDVRNRLIKVSKGENVVENTYNGEGLRVAKTVDNQTLRYLYEYDRIILETDGSGSNVTARNVYGINLINRSVDGQTLYYLYNGHGDVTALVSGSIVIASYYYDAFGVPIEETGSANNPYRYAGYEYDTEVSLYNLKARFYDAGIARFLQEDTYWGSINDPLSLNLYTYCRNEPIMYTDPTGNTYVYGNAIDLANAREILGSGYTYIDTSSGSYTIQQGSIIVGGTGAIGGVGADVDISGAHRISGIDRGKTRTAIENYQYLSSSSSGSGGSGSVSTAAIVETANVLSSMNINLGSSTSYTSQNFLNPTSNVSIQTVKSTNNISSSGQGTRKANGTPSYSIMGGRVSPYTPGQGPQGNDVTALDTYVNILNRATAISFGQFDDGGNLYVTEQQAENNRTAAIFAIGELTGASVGAALKVTGKTFSDSLGNLMSKFRGAGEASGKTGGRLGNSATRAQNSQIADYLESEGWTITGGGGRVKEEYLPGINGAKKGSNYVDITATKDGKTIRINTVDTYKNGTPTTREINAANSINTKTNDNSILIPKGAGLGNLESLIK